MRNKIEYFIGKALGKKSQQALLVVIVMVLATTILMVRPWATDSYEDIYDRATLDYRIATAIANGDSQVLIDYYGDGWDTMKSWLKEECLKYSNLIQYTDEFACYNYDGSKLTYWSYGDKKRVKIVFSYKVTNDELATVMSYVDNVIATNGIASMNTYNKVLAVHDYLIANFTYGVNNDNVYQMINDGTANCYAYTMLNYLFLNRLGIPVRTTSGRLNTAHIWNAVQLDGIWYYEDVTWDTVGSNKEYFLISSDKLQKTHIIEGNFIADCPIDYVYNGNIMQDGNNSGVETPEGGNGNNVGDIITDTETNKPQVNVPTPDDTVIEETPAPTPTPAPTTPGNSQTDKLLKLQKLLKNLKNLKSSRK